MKTAEGSQPNDLLPLHETASQGLGRRSSVQTASQTPKRTKQQNFKRLERGQASKIHKDLERRLGEGRGYQTHDRRGRREFNSRAQLHSKTFTNSSLTVHSTISKDLTASGDARQALQLAEFGQKLYRCLEDGVWSRHEKRWKRSKNTGEPWFPNEGEAVYQELMTWVDENELQLYDISYMTKAI